jgi:hypothetical protein
MTTAVILNVVLAVLVLAMILGLKGWAIATQHADRGVALVRRARHRQRAAARPRYGSADARGEVWPAI